MIEFIKNLLATQGLSEEMTLSISNAVMAVIILLISTLIYLIAKKVLLRVLGTIITKSKTKLGDALLRNKVFERIIYIIPAFIIHASAPVFPAYQVWIQRIAFCYMVFVFLLALNKLFDAIDDKRILTGVENRFLYYWNNRDHSRTHRPVSPAPARRSRGCNGSASFDLPEFHPWPCSTHPAGVE